MKNVFLSACFLMSVSAVSFSQNQNLNSAISYFKDYTDYKGGPVSLQKAKENIDIAANGEGTKDKPKTWLYRGNIYQSVFDMNLKNEISKSTEADMNKKYAAAYGTISTAELDEALKSFQKAMELDVKKDFEKECKARINNIANLYGSKADAFFAGAKYADAVVYYEQSYEMKNAVKMVDTATIYRIAASSAKIGDFKKAEQFYGKLIEIKYKPEKIYLTMIYMYQDAKDTAAARRMIQTARAAMPDSYVILTEETNLYTMGMDRETSPAKKNAMAQKGIDLLNAAIAKNPTEPALYLVLGNTYSKLAFPKDTSGAPMAKPADHAALAVKAEEAYKKAVEIRSDYETNSELGIYYNNWCADILKNSDNIKDAAKKKAEEKRADDIMLKAITYLEKANELKPGNRNMMKTLRQLYYRVEGESERYKKIDAEIKALK